MATVPRTHPAWIAAAAAEAAVEAAVRADYPELWGWRVPPPWSRIRESEIRVRDLRAHPARFARAAAARISEAYGLGAGSAWLERHGLVPNQNPEARAAAQVLASLAAIQR